jgi:hypothetical protein
MWNYETRVPSLVFHNNNRITSTAETAHEIYVGTFFICKYVKYFEHIVVPQLTTTTAQYKQDLDQVISVAACFIST